MTKEEVASIVAYCAENNISHKTRLAELGVSISDSTMNDWYAAICERLKPLYDLFSALGHPK